MLRTQTPLKTITDCLGPALDFFLPCSYDLGSRDSFLLDFCVLSPGITLSTTQVPMLMEIVAAATAFTVVIIY